ncbi:ATP-binding protein [Reyranella sp.]|uniref:ATP-binding protein n=1 Tax=Reyranella sp. TaxID=1929291 RepID=UPI0027243927|nr:ATP-binding protein [Reyranella sp.]MDO8973363.1 ATP-binding protein [Reyranella sp.]
MISAERDTSFLAGGGEMGALMRAHDWKTTPVGEPAGWPQSLRTAVRLLLNCGHPMYIWWGPELICFYNDAYRRSIGPERHPSSLGQPGRAVWEEIWPIIGPQIEQVTSGRGATWHENHLVPITRNGRREDVYWTYSYSPIDDADAPHGVGGVLVVCSETTQKVLTEQQLLAENERQRRMFQKAPGFIAVLRGPDHIYEYVNEAYIAIAGPRDFIGHTVREALPELEGQGFYELLDRVYRTGERFIAQAMSVRLSVDASTRLIDFVYEPIRDEAGEVYGIFVGGHDVTAHKDAERQSLLNEESLRLTTEAAEIGIWDVDFTTDTLAWSPRTKAMFGFSPDAVCTLDDFYRGLHPEDRDATTRAFGAALDPAIRAPYDVQYRVIGHDDGVVRWIAAKGKGLFDADGRCYRAVGTAINISARKLAEARHAFMLELSDALRGIDTDKALNQACALMGRFFGVSRVGYGHLDPVEDVFDYSVCWTDGRAQPLLGRIPAHAFGKKIVARLGAGETVVVNDLQTDPLSDEAETRATAQAVDTRSILVVPFVRAGRLRTIVYLNDRPVRRWQPDEVAFMEEVAERTRQVIERGEAEAALRALNATLEARVEARTAELRATEDALRQAQKMEAIGQLTGGIAHDFNNLLQGITGSLDLVQRRIGQGRLGDLDRFITGAMASANRAAALTHRLLAFARRQPLDPRPVPVSPLVGSMEELLRRTLSERIELELKLAGGLWLTRCDANQLESAILNLAINARDAMPEGGQLVIDTHNRQVDQATASAHIDRSAGDYVCISVSDTGTGMDAETIARAFEPFFTTKPLGQGTGLGLSMIYGFARQSEGYVEIESSPGRGTTVHLCLPRFEGEADDEVAAGFDAAAPAETGETVLVIEDEPVVRGLVVEVLADLGYRVIEAVDGPQGLEIVQSAQRIDLLITDVGLPVLNGRQVADAARALRPDLKVLFMTGYAEKAALVAGSLDARMAVITKPFVMETLATRVREIVEAG